MGLLGFLNGGLGRKNVTKLVDGAVSGVDKLFFTREERADYLQKVAQNQLEFLKTTINESSARSLTRRYIAVMIMGVFLLLLLFGAVTFKFDQAWADYILAEAKSLATLALMVAGFYFGSYAIGQYVINPLRKINKRQNNEQKTETNR